MKAFQSFIHELVPVAQTKDVQKDAQRDTQIDAQRDVHKDA